MAEKMNDLLTEAFKWRYAVKQFDATRKISDKDWEVLTQSLQLAPSSYGLQPWKFLVIQNPNLRKALREVSWKQSQVTDCSHFVVFATKKVTTEADVHRLIARTAQMRGVPLEGLNGYRDMMIGDIVRGPRSKISGSWAQRQSYIAMGFLMESAALLKIDSCPMEGLDPSAYDKLLGLEQSDWATVAAVALGYRHKEDKYQFLKKIRYDMKEVIDYRN